MTRRQVVRAAAVVCMLSFVLVWVWQSGTPALAQVTRMDGRHLLFQGRYVINAKGNSIEESAVFKIDTQTGTVSVYREGQMQDGQLFKYFERIPDR